MVFPSSASAAVGREVVRVLWIRLSFTLLIHALNSLWTGGGILKFTGFEEKYEASSTVFPLIHFR